MLAATGVMSLAACGVPIDSAPHPVELPGSISMPGPSQTTASQGPLTETLYLVKDGHLVGVTRHLPQHPSAEEQLAHLLAGPTGAERQQGLSSALGGIDLRLGVQVRDRRAVVELATSIEGTGRTDDILAFAQIVCTLTARDDIGSVTFTRAGQQVEVPRADSSLTRDPLTAADYTPLITKP